MATGDITVKVVPPLSAVAQYTIRNEYGNDVILSEKSIARDPDLLTIYINEQRAAASANLLQILDGGNRLTLILSEN
jgi:hypothetical protein